MALEQWLPRSRRNAGNYVINSITVPVGIDAVRIQLDVDPVEFDTQDKTVTTFIEASPDNGNTWIIQQYGTFVGSTPPPSNRGGVVGWFAYVNGLSTYVGRLIRVRFETTGAAFRWGLLGEVLP
jgi:hypothetical protein